MRRDAPPSTRSLTTPTVPGEEMLAAGVVKFGWLNAFDAAAVIANLNLSVSAKLFEIEMFCMLYPGPSRTLAPELPNLPGGGGTKHPASNQRFTSRSAEGRFPLQIRSGRPPEVLVFEGSDPEKVGEK